MKKVLHAVNYLHQKSIIHRDLKPENIMCTGIEDTVDYKLIDFGLSTKYEGSKSDELVGICYYSFI